MISISLNRHGMIWGLNQHMSIFSKYSLKNRDNVKQIYIGGELEFNIIQKCIQKRALVKHPNYDGPYWVYRYGEQRLKPFFEGHGM
jgi:hypothetical protein